MLTNQAPELNEKEQRVFNKLQNTPGLVLAHGLGTGKTRTSIQMANQLGMPTEVVVPAALQDNYKKELNKWLGQVPEGVNIESQQAVARRGLSEDQGLLVVDEAHRARDATSRLLNALKQTQAQKRLLLTATPVYNHPVDIAPLINLAANKKVLPETRPEFEQKYIGNKEVKPNLFARLMGVESGQESVLQNTNELKKVFGKYVDYEAGNKSEGFPTSSEEIVKVPMGTKQQEVYDTIMNKAPLWMRWKVRAGLPPNKKEMRSLQAFLTGPRQASNSNIDFVTSPNSVESPKAQQAAQYLLEQIQKNPQYKGVVYSNYLNSGLTPYKKYLEQNNIPYGEFSGSIPAEQRDQMVRDYNADKIKALLISSAGAEGLDLKGTRLLQILEPHFNREKEKQIIGRAIRYQSHAALPEDQRNVLIQRYLAQPRGGMLNRLMGNETVRGTDEYISDLADKKERLNRQVIDLIAQSQKP